MKLATFRRRIIFISANIDLSDHRLGEIIGITAASVTEFRNRHNLKKPSGKFKKGHKPWHKGTKNPTCGKPFFKPGHKFGKGWIKGKKRKPIWQESNIF